MSIAIGFGSGTGRSRLKMAAIPEPLSEEELRSKSRRLQQNNVGQIAWMVVGLQIVRAGAPEQSHGRSAAGFAVLACGAAVCFLSLRGTFAGFARSAAARTIDQYRRQITVQRNRLLDHRVLSALVGGALSIELLAGADKAAMPAITAMFVIFTFAALRDISTRRAQRLQDELDVLRGL